MSDTVGAFEVERDVSTGEHLVTVYVDTRRMNAVDPYGEEYTVDLPAADAEALADVLRHHAEPATCWQCGRWPSMPGDQCPRCQEASER